VRGRSPDGQESEETKTQHSEASEESEATAIPHEGGSSGVRESARGETVQREKTQKGPMNETTNPDPTYTPLTLPQIGNAFEYVAWGIALFVIYVVVSTAKNR
jgi:hypothetical protein